RGKVDQNLGRLALDGDRDADLDTSVTRYGVIEQISWNYSEQLTRPRARRNARNAVVARGRARAVIGFDGHSAWEGATLVTKQEHSELPRISREFTWGCRRSVRIRFAAACTRRRRWVRRGRLVRRR